MKIIHVITAIKTGGAQNALLKHVKYSHENFPDTKHIIISLSSRDTDFMNDKFEPLQIHYLDFEKWYKALFSLLNFIRILRREQADIVRTWLYHSDFLGGLISKLFCSSAIIWSVRSFEVQNEGNKKILILRWFCARLSPFIPDKVIFNSSAALSLHRELGYNCKKLLYIPNGFQINHQTNVKNREKFWKQYLQCAEKGVILHAGRLHVIKDQATLVCGYELYRERTGNNELLVILGDGPQRSYLQNLVSLSKYRDDIYILGNVNNVMEFMRNSDVFVLTSLSEAFPQVLGEAMSVGLPCISSDVGDVRHLIPNMDLIFPAANAQRLSEILQEFFELSADDRMMMKKRAKDHILKKFALNKVEDMTHEVYEGFK